MAISAKVRNKQIDTGKVLHALVQGEHASGNITFQIIGEEELVEDFNSTYFYLLYTRPSDTRPNVLLLTNKQLQDDVISVTFKPTSYFTAQDGTVQIQIMATDTEGLSIDSETGTISGSVIWQTFPGAMFVHASQLTGTETIIEENVLTQYLAGMQELYSQTEDAEGDAADYAQLAKAWASKTNGAVESGEMSAKYYAGTADSRAKEAEGYAVGTVSGSPSASFAGKNAKELASDAQDWAKGTRSDGKTPSHTSDNAKAYAESAADSAAIVSAHATAIDAIGDDLTNIDAVAADILDDDSAIDAVAANITNVNAVAANETNINAVNTNKTNINTVAGKASDITTVAGIASDVSAVAAIASDVAAVEDIDDDVSAVAAIAVDVGVVADAATDVAAVADGITDVGTVATNISDVGAVASDITKIAAVADDLTNIDAVADDLANIDAAEANALKAEGWANGTQNGTDVDPSSPYYHNNAKYWAGSVPTLKGNVSALDKRVSNLEESLDVITEIEYPDATYGKGEVPPNKSKYAEVGILKGVGRIRNNVLPNGNFASLDGWNRLNNTASTSDNVLTMTVNNNVTADSSTWVQCYRQIPTVAHLYLIVLEVKPSVASRIYARFGAYSDSPYLDCSANVWNKIAGLKTGTAGNTEVNIFSMATSLVAGSTIQARNFFIVDLTVYFNRNIPTGLDIATIQRNYPELLIPSDYGTSVVSPTYEAVKSVGRNLFNGVWEDGYLNSSNGSVIYSSGYKTTDYIPIKPLTEFYIKGTQTTTDSVNVAYYGQNKEFLYHVGSVLTGLNLTFTTQAGLYYMRITITNASTKTEGFMLNKSDSQNGTYTPYMTDTLTLPTPVTLKEAGSVADTYELNVEVEGVARRRETQRVKSVVYDGSSDENWQLYGSAQRFYIQKADQKINSGSTVANLTCDKLMVTRKDWVDQYDKAVGVEYRSFVLRIDSTITTVEQLRTWLAQNPVTINFELDTPVVTLSDPIPDPFIQVEGGGTIEPVQTNEPEIDSAMTVTYVNKITA